MPKRTVILQMEVPAEFAELLAEHRDGILAFLHSVVAETKRAALHGELAAIEQVGPNRQMERIARFKRIGRQAYRLYRQRRREIPKSIKGADRTERRKALILEIARELNESFEFVNAALSRHRSAVDERARRLRRFVILRLTLIGWNNEEISEHIGVHRNTVSNVLGKLRRHRFKGRATSHIQV